DNPANVTAVKAKAEDVVDKWQKRTGNRSTFSSDDPKLKYTSLQLENIENKQQANEITKQLQSVKDSLLGFI
ncbi:hypothetical protein OZK63_42585, partial [Streptomyces sp. UMAF16]|nr:hypothetical protein [Streptomyces sp. UMAF16]